MMTTYYPGGSETQADSNLQTLYLMNPSFSGYPSSDTHNQPLLNMLLLNPSPQSQQAHAVVHPPSSLPNASPIPHHNTQQQHLVGIPLAPPPQPPVNSSTSTNHQNDPSRPPPAAAAAATAAATIHEMPAATLHGLVPRVHYNLWSTPPVDLANSHIPTAIAVAAGGGADVTASSSMGFRRPPTVPPTTAVAVQQQQQQQQEGLSLSLNNSPNNKSTAAVLVSDHPQAGGVASGPMGDIGSSGSPAAALTSAVTNVGGVGGVILGSKYLKAAQELLDEVVNVEKVMVKDPSDQKARLAVMGPGERSSTGGGGRESSGKRSGSGGAGELSTAQRQELQMKKAKLLNMLEEVEQRYSQYHRQMQIVVASFEQAGGIGAARSYTALALQTISKHFRCLKDAIVSQIKATCKSLGEADDHGGSTSKVDTVGSTKLRFVDHQLRQQRALQQLGMVQHSAWRPQRGLPERAVSVLRAWLFEHFLHPYPKDSDKHMLAKQTGLSRSQVSNWFINARVRLWKPMVEEMYLEEMKAQEQNGSSEDQNTATMNNSKEHNNNKDSTMNSKSPTSMHPHHQQIGKSFHVNHNGNLAPATTTASTNNLSNSTTILSPTSASTRPTLHHTADTLQGFSLIGSSEMDSFLIQRSPKRQRSSDMQNNSPSSVISMEMEMKPGGPEPINRELFTSPTAPNHVSGFGAYPIGEIGSRFDPDQQLAGHRYLHRNGVSLTLGLPHCENLSLSRTPHRHHHHQVQHNFVPTQNIQLGRRLEIEAGDQADFCSMSTSQPSHSSAGTGGYNDGIDLQSRKRFAAPLLPDFVT